MNKKGFSLVELLVVIVILGLILVIAVPNVIKLVDDFGEKDQIEMLKKSAISAAKEYVADGKINSEIKLAQCSDRDKHLIYIIVVEDLIRNNYLDYNEYYNNKTIDVTYDCINKKFIYYTFEPELIRG